MHSDKLLSLSADKLVPKPTLMDTLALSRTGYPKPDAPTLADEVFTTTSEPMSSKATTVTTWSTRYSSRGNDSTSTLEDDFEDLTEIINAELTKLDREIVNYVANGTNYVRPLTPQVPDASLDNVLNSSWLGEMPSNGTAQGGIALGAPKIEPTSLDEEMAFNEQNVPSTGIPTQTIGNLSVGRYPDDTKPGLIPMEEGNIKFQLSSSKMRGANSPCMFSNAASTAERAPVLSHMITTLTAPVGGGAQQMPSARNANSVQTSCAPPRNPAYASSAQGVMSGRLPSQRPAIPSTVTTVSQMAPQKEQQLQFVQLLKEALPDDTYTDKMVVDLVDEMMVDQEDEVQRKEDDLRLVSLLQQGGLMQTEGFIKQEVVTPTLSQPTYSFPSVSNSIAAQSCQSQMPTSTFTATTTFSASEPAFGVGSRVPQNGTVHNRGSPASFQNGNSQFMNQEDSNMNFLNSLPNNHTGLPGNTPGWNTNLPPKQNVMQQALRTLLQNADPSQSTNSGLLPQSNVPFLPQQSINFVPQNGSRSTQGNSFDMNMVSNMSQLDSLLQSTQFPAPSYQNVNGTNMPFSNQNYAKFDMNRKL